MTAATEHPTAADATTRQRVRGLLTELEEVRVDQAMAARFNALTTRPWLAELAREEHDCWCHIAEALAPQPAAVEVSR